MTRTDMPVSTEWTLNAAEPEDKNAIASCVMIVCPDTSSKGSGFLLENGWVVTNEHIVRGANLEGVIGLASSGERIDFAQWHTNRPLDLAILKPKVTLKGGLTLHEDEPPAGAMVKTWGYPFGHNGPAPLLSVGYVAGYRDHQTGDGPTKRILVNGAFNPGNSGGPLIRDGTDNLVGVVVSKHVPLLDKFHEDAIRVLRSNQSGLIFNAKDGEGKDITFAESQLVAMILEKLREVTQVMIGEAVRVTELKKLMDNAGIDY